MTCALNSKLPPTVLRISRAGDDLLELCEKKKRLFGPQKVNRVEYKMIFISFWKSVDHLATLRFYRKQLKTRLELKRLLNGLTELQSVPVIGFTEVFFPSDKRVNTDHCKAAMKREVD